MTSEVTMKTEQGPEDQAHIDKMVAKAEGRQTEAPAQQPQGQPEGQQTQAPERPAWLPEGFNTPEELAEAYAKLQKPDGAPAQEQQQAAEAAVENAGLDMEALGEKLATQGNLDDSDYEALAKVGISRDIADTYIEGQRAIGEAMVTRLQASVGGEEQFNEIISWAANNLPKEQVSAFNKVVDTGDEQTVSLALAGLAAQYRASGNQKPQLLRGDRRGGSNAVAGFRSVKEMTTAMSDPRYSSDPAYRADVEERLAISDIF